MSGQDCTVVLFGATGDLASRKLYPALFGLWQDGLLEGLRVLGVGRQVMDDAGFQAFVLKSLQESSETDPPLEGNLQRFCERVSYVHGDFFSDELYQQIGEVIGSGKALFYLSTPPSLFASISEKLGEAGLQSAEGWRRIVIEKPFGRDLASARELNDTIHRVWEESQVFRIDHYLGKETVQNLLAVRFGNAFFEPLWNRQRIDHIQITAAEELGLEGRASYYEEAGVVRDMVQNHLLQLLALTAMEPPASFDAAAIRDEKVKVLRSTRVTRSLFGQYTAGRGEVGYREEPKVSSESTTPTYVALRLEIDNWRWQGVPFFLRTGKSLPKKYTEIAVILKEPPLPLFSNIRSSKTSGEPSRRNALIFRIQPNEGLEWHFFTKLPGKEMNLEEASMNFDYHELGQPLESPYSRLLLDAIQGDATLFPREDEVDRSWQIVDPLLDVPESPLPYAAGSTGPQEAEHFLGADRRWREA